jgi:hypothetical protein
LFEIRIAQQKKRNEAKTIVECAAMRYQQREELILETNSYNVLRHLWPNELTQILMLFEDIYIDVEPKKYVFIFSFSVNGDAVFEKLRGQSDMPHLKGTYWNFLRPIEI